MELQLTCGHCDASWVVERWTPTAMSCPKCGSEELGDRRSLTEDLERIAKQKASAERKRLANATTDKHVAAPQPHKPSNPV